MTHTTEAAATSERELVIIRLLDAPRLLVFRAWTMPEHFARWWGPRGFTTVSCEAEVRSGGAWHRVMRSPDGVDFRSHGVYREIVEPERLVFTFNWEDRAELSEHEMLVTVTLVERADKTELTLRQAPFATIEAREGHREGWGGSLDRLADYLAAGTHC